MAQKGDEKRSETMKGNNNAEKLIQWDIIDKLLEINCAGEEIASVLGVDYDTIQNHCKKEKKCLFSEYIKTGNDKFKISLKRLQYRSAKGVFITNKDKVTEMLEKPSVTMQIWLGKQYLDQRDKSEQEHGFSDDFAEKILNIFPQKKDLKKK